MTDPFEALRTARAVLEEGLALLDRDPSPEQDGTNSLRRINERLGALENPIELRSAVPEADLERFDDGLEELQRLNAVLLTTVRRDREDVTARLAAVRTVRKSMRPHGAAPAPGQRCDIAG